MIEIFTCGNSQQFPQARPFHEAGKDNVSGRDVVLLTGVDALPDAVAELRTLGASRVYPVNADSPTVADDLDRALATAKSGQTNAAPSASLLTAGRACSINFPRKILGERLGELVSSLGRLSGAPDEYVFATFLSLVSGLVAGYYSFQVRPGFKTSSIVWTINVGDSSSNKSVAQSMIAGPLIEIEQQSFGDYRAELEAANDDAEKDPGSVKPPTRAIGYNQTLEASQMMCAQQERGAVLVQDEFRSLAALIGGRYSSGGYEGDFCTAYNGDPMIVDRKSLKSPLQIKCWGLAMTANCPPSVLNEIAQTSTLLTNGSGFDQRLWYFWPRLRELEVRPEPDDHLALVKLKELYQYLFSVRKRPGSIALQMSDEARSAFEQWRIKFLKAKRKASSEVDGFDGKMPGTILKIAGLLAVIDAALRSSDPERIEYDHFERALVLGECLSAHRRRIELERGQPPVERLAAEMASWIIEQRAKTIDTFEIRRSVIPGIRTEATLRAVLCELQSAKWLESYISPRRDEPLPSLIRVRPQVFDLITQH